MVTAMPGGFDEAGEQILQIKEKSINQCFLIVKQLEKWTKGGEIKIIFTRRRREGIAIVLC